MRMPSEWLRKQGVANDDIILYCHDFIWRVFVSWVFFGFLFDKRIVLVLSQNDLRVIYLRNKSWEIVKEERIPFNDIVSTRTMAVIGGKNIFIKTANTHIYVQCFRKDQHLINEGSVDSFVDRLRSVVE